MASGEHVVEDLFGFAELTGETVSPAVDTANKNHMIIDKKPEDSTKFHFEKEKIKRDTDEVVVPMFFEKSGVKKYKVLARHQVEDDDDIKRPVSSERESPNSEEQRKENIDIDRKSENVQKLKTDAKGNVKRPKLKRNEKGIEQSMRNLKQSLNAKKLKGKISRIQHKKNDEKRNKNIEQKEKKVESSIAKDPRAVNYEFHDDSDSNTELNKIKTKVEDVVVSEKIKLSSTSTGKIEDSCRSVNIEKAQLAQNPLKIECHVKLRRDPSIENFYKPKSDSDSKASNESECSNSEIKTDDSNAADKCTKQSDSAEDTSVFRQNSSEECLIKAANMVYNVDIQVRKSGRLQSAKCASRYRGDYGIRVDTYKQLINRTVNTFDNLTESEEKEVSSKRVEVVINRTDEKHAREERVELPLSVSKERVDIVTDQKDVKQVKNERLEGVTSEELRKERLLNCVKNSPLETEHSEYKDCETVACNYEVNLPMEICKSESSAEEFTVLKEPVADNSGIENISRIQTCSKTNHLIEQRLVSNCKDGESKSQAEIAIELKQKTGRDLLNSDEADPNKIKVQLCENEVSEEEAGTSKSAEIYLLQPESSEYVQKAYSETVDNCDCETGNEIVRRNYECNIKAIEAECPKDSNEVPCCNVIEGYQSCECDNKRESNTLLSERNACNELADNEVKTELTHLVPINPETETDSKTKRVNNTQLTKENINENLILIQSRTKVNKECTGYVHSVGKSVNKMQKRIRTIKSVPNVTPENTENEVTPEPSPVKDPAKVLETLRQKLFESAGADLLEADKVPKQFESKLISSKQRQCEDSKSLVLLDLQEKDRQIRDSDSTSGRSGKSTPRCSTPRQEASREILEEVAMSLDVLHQAKRRFEHSSKGVPSKRQRFEEKTFLLRSMMKKNEDVDGTRTSQDIMIEDEKPAIAGKIAERTRCSRSSAESSASKSDIYKIDRKSNVETSNVRVRKKDTGQGKPIQKPKPVKCSACSHIFKTKELLRKHFPCRIRQTRTWSQNKLRPNRAVKRIENSSKMFVCKLPKIAKPEPSKPRPQLLTYRKTKFRRVKGKRRRKLYQLIQELRQRRMPIKWHHLSIVYDDLSFKEQCLYKLGLICVGHASEGLEKYTAEEITVFEQHRAKEKWLMEDAQTFEHSIPDTLESLTDLNLSTDLSTDNQESNFLSPTHVITFPQEDIQNRNCDTDDMTKDDRSDGAINKTSVVERYEKYLKSGIGFPQFLTENIDPVERNVSPSFAIYPGLDEKETDTSYEDIVDIAELPEKVNADVSVQEYLEFFKSSQTKTDSDNKIACTDEVMARGITSLRSQNIAQLETFTAIEEATECLEEALEISSDSSTMISVKGNLVDNPLKRANVTEVNFKTTELQHVNETNRNGVSGILNIFDSQQGIMNDISQEIKASSESELFPIKEQVKDETSLSCTLSKNANVTDLKNNSTTLESNDVHETQSLELSAGHVILSVLRESVLPSAEKDIKSVPDYKKLIPGNIEKNMGKPVAELDNKQTYIDKSREGIFERSTFDAETQEQVKKFSPRKKHAVAPDIELYHQTATIDDKLLADTPLAVQHGRRSGKDTLVIASSSEVNLGTSKEEEIVETDYVKATKYDKDVDPDIILQASGTLKDILGDVEQYVHESKDMQLPHLDTHTTSSTNKDISAVFSKGTNKNLSISTVKGILKNAGPIKECAGLSPLKSDTGLSSGEIREKSPGKKKIDFKTYAKRKGLIKEKEESDKECVQSEPNHENEDTKFEGIRNEKDENGKECLRSESSHEIEDGLLGRLLDAVNLIDSIIEEHKYQSGPEEDDDAFNAITPEMAFEAAISNTRVENTHKDASSKPYDIESTFPYLETGEIIDVQKLHCTGITDMSENSENGSYKSSISERNLTHGSDDINVFPHTEIISDSSIPNVYPVTLSESNEVTDIETNRNSDICYDGDKEKVDYNTESIRSVQMVTRKESPSNIESQFRQTAIESRLESKQFKNLEITMGNWTEIGSQDSLEECKVQREMDLNENISDQGMTGKISTDELSSEDINNDLNPLSNTDACIEKVDQEIRKKKDELSNIKNIYLEDPTHEETYMKEKVELNADEIMKSPEHAPLKRKRMPDNATSIKESKRDFTIKYEMNGIVIKENLLTGDKNVVENSSPFRSSAESDSNFDKSPQSELDVSSVVENDTSFSSKVDVEEADAAENSTSASEKMACDSVLNINIEDSYIRSSEEIIVNQRKETDDKDTEHVLESCLSHEIDPELIIENQIEIVMEKAGKKIDKQESEKDTDLVKEDKLDTYTEEKLDVSDKCEEEPDNVPCLEMEPLLGTDVQLLRKVSDDHSVGSPPVLEKVEVSDNSIDEQDQQITNLEITLTTEGGPPQLEPQRLEENKEHVKQEDKQEAANQGRQERHFLDILGMVSSDTPDSAIFPDFGNKAENISGKGSKRSEKPILEELYCEESTLNDSIGRHFSDAVSETVEAPKTPKSKLQLLFDKSGKGEVTLAQIKDVLSPFSKKGKKKSISKESLLKIKSGIADLLSNMKKPVRKDPTWLKRYALSGYSRKQNIKKNINYKEEKRDDLESSCDESISAEEEIVYISSDSSESVDLNTCKDNFDRENKKSSEGSIADTIMEMLDSLEDKGSVADNMSNLLQILAENLGFRGKGKVSEPAEDSSFDSDYSCSDATILIRNSSTENTEKELIADYLKEGEQPPSLDDIRIACNFEMSLKKGVTNTIKCDKKADEGIVELAQQFGGKITDSRIDSSVEKSGQQQIYLKGVVGPHLNNSEENHAVTTELTRDDKRKATTLFKSITELNSIETDEESNTDESFDPVSVSARLSELKDTNTWDFTSDYNSDQEQSENFDSEVENNIHTSYIEEHLLANTRNEGAAKFNSDQVEAQVSNSTDIDDDTANISDVSLLSSFDIQAPKDMSDESLTPASSECYITNTGSRKRYSSFMKKMEEAAAIFSSEAEAKENELNDKNEGERNEEDVNNQSLKVVIDSDSDYKDKDVSSEGKDLNNDRRACAEEDKSNNKDSADAQESAKVARDETSLPISEETKFTNPTNSLKSFEQSCDQKLITEMEDLHGKQCKPKLAEGAKRRNTGLHTDDLEDERKIEYNHIADTFMTDVCNDSQISEDDDDTNETVTYEECEQAKTDFSGSVDTISDTNKDVDVADDNTLVRDCQKNTLISNRDSPEVSLLKKPYNTEIEIIPPRKDAVSSLITQGNEFDGNRRERQCRETYTFSSPQLNCTSERGFKDEHLIEKRSTSLNIDINEFSDNFCESIAEKVKRKQRERSRSVCYSFNPWLYYSAAYVREVTKPAKKEISVFRSSILEKRAREKSFSPEKEDIGCSSRKKRNSSVPKEARFGTNENTCTDVRRSYPEPKPAFQVKPCSVAIPKLTDDIIHRYTDRKRKPEEDTSPENRPPIKVTIKLSQIVYPPNSPYGSTSTSSDNYRSGYESCSEESEIDVNEPDEENGFGSEKQEEIIHNPSDAENVNYTTVSEERSIKTDVDSREPLKIKMRTLLTKMSSCEEGQDIQNSFKEIDQVKQFSGSFNDSSNETNVEVSTGELIESEVLHDIEQECEKAKSREIDVMFYLSETDEENGLKNSEKSTRQLIKAEIENGDNLGAQALSVSSIQAECGESDVDLSDSDTDSEIQEEIDKILNSRSSEDISTTIVHDDEKESIQTKLEKEKNSLMKMIISDLRLSESESESEAEYSNKTEEIAKPEGKTCKEKVLKDDVECTIEQADDERIRLSETRDVINFKISENSAESKIILNSGTQSSEVNLYPRESQITEKSVQKSVTSSQTEQSDDKDWNPRVLHVSEKIVQAPLSATLPRDNDKTLSVTSPSRSVSVTSPRDNDRALSVASPLDDDKFLSVTSPRDNDISLSVTSPWNNNTSLMQMRVNCADEGFIGVSDVAEDVTEPLDLSVSSKESVKKELNEFPREETRASSKDIEEKKFPVENLVSSSSGLQLKETNRYSDSKSFYSNTVMSSESSKDKTVNGTECLKLTEDKDNLNLEFSSMLMAQSGKNDIAAHKLYNVDNASDSLDNDNNKILLPGGCEEVETANKEESLKRQVFGVNEVSSDSFLYIEAACQEESKKEENFGVDISCGSADMEPDNCVSSPEIVSENTVISEEETKEMENVNAVKSLEEDVFHDVQPVQDCSEEDMVYYAVELSDDFETNEAVVNLETVELIEGPVITENNDTHEGNIVDTNIIQSHVNDQFELSNETLNEQIVETLNEIKLPSEIRNNNALGNMTEVENPVFYPTVNDVKSKYLYGINEDSQSSNEVVEELVTEIVNDNTVLQDVEQVTMENQQMYCEVLSVESLRNTENYTHAVPVIVESSHEREKFPVIPVNIESSDVLCGNLENKEMDVMTVMSESDKVSKVTDQPVRDMETFNSTDNEMRGASDSVGVECTSYRESGKWTDNDHKNLSLNISEYKTDTRHMCSQRDGLVQFKADNLSHGYDLIGSETGVKESNELDQNIIHVESCGTEPCRPAIESSLNSFVLGYSNCAMVIEHNDENDYIITQNENFDDDDDDGDEVDDGDDDDAMEIV